MAQDQQAISNRLSEITLDSTDDESSSRNSVDDLNNYIGDQKLALQAAPSEDTTRADVLCNLGVALRQRHEATGETHNLIESVTSIKLAIDAAANESDRARYLHALSGTTRARYYQSSHVEHLDTEIQLLNRAIQLTPLEQRCDKADRLRCQGHAYRLRFEKTLCKTDINAAIEAHRQALILCNMEGDACDQAAFRSELGFLLKSQLLDLPAKAGESPEANADEKEDIDDMENLFKECLRLSGEDDARQAEYLNGLGCAQLLRYHRDSSSSSNIDEAVEFLERAAMVLADDSPARLEALSDYAYALEAKFVKTRFKGDLSKAIGVLREATELAVDTPWQSLYLQRLGDALYAEFDLSHDLGDLNASIDTQAKAVERMPVDFTQREKLLTDLGKALIARYELSSQAEDLDKSIDAFQMALPTLPKHEPLYLLSANHLAWAFRTHFERNSKLNYLEGAIKWNRELLDLALDAEERAITLNNLGTCLQNMFESIGDPAILQEAIKFHESAARSIPSGSLSRSTIIAGLAGSLKERYDLLGSSEDLNEVIRLGNEAVAIPGLKQVRADEYPLMLTNLGVAFIRRYEVGGAVNDLENALAYCRIAEKESRINSSLQPLCCNNYVYCLLAKFNYEGLACDLDEAAATAKVVIDMVRGHDRILPIAQSNFCHASIWRLQLRGTMDATLEELLLMTEEMMKALPKGHINRLMGLNCRALVLYEVFQNTPSIGYLDSAVEALEEAVDASKLNNKENHIVHLKSLAESLLTRFEWTGEQNDLHYGFNTASRAVQQIPETHPQYFVHLLTQGRAFLQRAMHTDSICDLNSSIKIFEQSAQQLSDQNPKHSLCLNNLATALGTRFVSIGTTEDLNAAVQAAVGATKSLSASSLNKAVCFSNLGRILMFRFSRTGRDDDIDIAADLHSRTLDMTPKGHWQYVGFLEKLSSALMFRYWKHNRAEYLHEAVKYSRQAVDLAPKDSPERPLYLTNMSEALLELLKSSETIKLADDKLEEAIEASRAADYLSISYQGQKRARILLIFGKCLEYRFKRTGNESDALNAIQVYEKISVSSNFPIEYQITASVQTARMLYPQDIQRANKMLSRAVELLPRIISRRLLRNDQQFVLSSKHGLGSDAAALALRAGKDASEAVRLLELGRGVIASLYTNEHSDLTDLEKSHPELATRFRAIQHKVATVDEDILIPDIQCFLQSQAARRHEIIQEFDRVILTIRETTGFNRFLLGPSAAELKACAVDGPIVYLNASRFGAGALIIRPEEIEHLQLPGLKYDEIMAKAQELTDIRDKDSPIRRRLNNIALRKILQWLWDVAVREILDHLGFTNVLESGDVWPKIWWIPVGILSLFPIHAAGYHASSAATMNRVISCYAISAKLLVTSMYKASSFTQSQSEQDAQAQHVCLTSMKTTPQRTDLRHAENEIRAVYNVLRLPKTVLSQPTKAQVMDELRRCSIVHFACHGEMDRNPSFSRILFADWESDPFQVQDMGSVEFGEKAQLAYLSSCHTGTSKDYYLLDEALHMAGACQVVGFPSVIGTLWKVMDEYAPIVTEDVYKAVWDGSVLDTRRAAHGLHFAMRKIKILSEKPRGKDKPMDWAPYIYVGA